MYRWLFLLVVLSSFWSCKKADEFFGNTSGIHLSGRITDTLTGKGVAGAGVWARWNATAGCFLCYEKEVGEGKTDSEGYFSITAKIDRDRFATYDLSISASLPDAYLETGDFAYIPRYTPDTAGLNLTAFPKADLTVKLVKSRPDSLIYFDFLYSFTTNGGRTGLFTGEPVSDTTFHVETAAGIYTKFDWTRYYAPGVYTQFSDSIICSASHDNVFTLTY